MFLLSRHQLAEFHASAAKRVAKTSEYSACERGNAVGVTLVQPRLTRRTIRKTSHMARCVTFAVARIHKLEIGEILHIFPSGTQSMGDRGSKKAYTGPRTGTYLPTKFGCDRSIVVGCRSRNDRQTDRQTE